MITFSNLGRHGMFGNQMFQYAALVGIKYKTGYEFVFDPEVRSLVFERFNPKEFVVDKRDTALHEYTEAYFHFDANVFNIGDNIDYRGYYQTEKYFVHCADAIRNEFTFKKETLEVAKSIKFLLNAERTVAVHVRRGDYLAYPNHHPFPQPLYYEDAMDAFDGEGIKFIVCSDDIKWCRENFKLPNIHFSELEATEDMCLMSLCDDHIIANSSFGWWSSWLATAPDKRIIAPKRWFGSAYDHYETNDIYTNQMLRF